MPFKTKDIINYSSPEYTSKIPDIDITTVSEESKTIEDLRNSEEFMTNADKALGWLGDNISTPAKIAGFGTLSAESDPIEALRDAEWNTVGMSSVAYNIKDAPDDVKEAFNYIRENFKNAKLGNLSQRVGAFLDIGLNILTDPVTLLAFLSAPFTGGSSLAANAAQKATIGQAIKTGLARFGTGEITKSTVQNAALGGLFYGTLENYSEQNIDMALDLQEEFSYGELGLHSAGGAAAGAALGKLIPVVTSQAKKLFSNKRTDGLSTKLADETLADSDSNPTLLPQAEELASKVEEKIKVPPHLLNVVKENLNQGLERGDSFVNIKQVEEIVSTIVEMETKPVLSDGDDVIRESLKKKYFMDENNMFEVKNIIQDYVKKEERRIPEGFITEFGAKWGYIPRGRENDREDIFSILDTVMDLGFRKKLTKEEESFLKTELDFYELNKSDLKEMVKDIEIYSADNLRPGQLDNLSLAKKFSEDMGGGQQTTEQVYNLMEGASKSPKFKATLPFKLSEIGNRLNSTFIVGKPTDKLRPFAKYSAKLKELLPLFRYNAFLKGVINPLAEDKHLMEKLAPDFHEVYQKYKGEWTGKLHSLNDEIALNMQGGISDKNSTDLVEHIRGAASTNSRIANIKVKVRDLLDNDIGEELFRRGLIREKEENYFPRLWDNDAIKKNQEGFKNLLVDDGYNIGEAESILKSMINDPKGYELLNGFGGTRFFYTRPLTRIKDDSPYTEFLDPNYMTVMGEYIDAAARSVAKNEVFGINNFKGLINPSGGGRQGFDTKWIFPIMKELKESGVDPKELIRLGGGPDQNGVYKEGLLEQIYRHTTQEGVKRFGNTTQTIIDWNTFLTRAAFLPLITITSLTEPLINIQKAGITKTMPAFFETLNVAFDTTFKNFYNILARDYKMKPNEIWQENRIMGNIMEQSMASVNLRASGDIISSNKVNKYSNIFFRAVLIDQWTKFVQMMSYNVGKRLIRGNLQELAEGGFTRSVAKHSTARLQTNQNQLLELGMDIEDGVKWINSGADTNNEFYKKIQEGAVRYTREIILPTRAPANIAPMAFTDYKTKFLFDLLRYPAGFSNTVIPNASRTLLRDTKDWRVPANTVVAAILMTQVARFTNWARSRGESENNKSTGEIYTDAVRRWGGLMGFEPFYRGYQAFKYTQHPIYGPMSGFLGPIGSDIEKVGRGNLLEWLGTTRVPSVGAWRTLFGEEFYDDYRTSLRNLEDKLLEEAPKPEGEERTLNAKGGLVEVPQAPEEPDERIDKMTGIPYNIQAGGAFIDEEDRENILK